MKVQSAVYDQGQWYPVEVEVALLPGLAGLYVLGDAGREIRECWPKMKSAFAAAAFRWPRTKKVVVNIKSPRTAAGREVELAIALLVLKLTGQIDLDFTDRTTVVGELGLDGEVQNLGERRALLSWLSFESLIAAPGATGGGISDLKGLNQFQLEDKKNPQVTWSRPVTPEWKFSKEVSELIAVVAAGEHATLLAGPHGSGKSTVMDAIYYSLPELDPGAAFDVQKRLLDSGESSLWRPRIAPHHSASHLTIIGGGISLRAGEVARAHGGVLMMDEYLEFPKAVQEALREPLEKGQIRISRGSRAINLAAQFLLLAATNLCPCGRRNPGSPKSCSLSLLRCLSHIHRLSGPMLDRFQVVGLSHRWTRDRQVSLHDIQQQVAKADQFRRARSQRVVNSRLSRAELLPLIRPKHLHGAMGVEGSERRELALLRVARTWADLLGHQWVDFEHISKARELVTEPHGEISAILDS